jgi:hypothetical protein
MAYLPFFVPALVYSHTNQCTNQVFVIFIGFEETTFEFHWFRYVSYAHRHRKSLPPVRMRLTWMKHVAVDSGEPQSVEELWKEYFADPSQWWDNRADKVGPLEK